MAIRKPQTATKPEKPKLTALPRRKKGQPLWEYLVALGDSMSAEDLAKFPTDGARNHDHYIYGTPKRYE